MRVDVQPVGEVAPWVLEALAAGLREALGVSVRLKTAVLDSAFAYDAARAQYYSTAILAKLAGAGSDSDDRMLGVIEDDLFVPVLTYVFGEAQLDGRCALVSRHRLREEFYGLPPNPALAGERLLKEALHEIGHTFGLRHCDDWRCAMAASHAVERLDLKSAAFCARCRRIVLAP